MELKSDLKSFATLTVPELYEIIKLRVDVFVVEQDCPYPDLDDKDQEADHLFLRSDTGIEAYLRILKAGVSYPEASIGRVIVKEKLRGLKIGHRIMAEAMNFMKTRGDDKVKISAQKHLKEFYENLGFTQVSEPYLEDGIPHIAMLAEL